jgi:hypothetical protein
MKNISKSTGHLIVAAFWLAICLLWSTKTQAQIKSTPYFCCDSISYWTDQGQGLFIGLDTTNIIHDADTIEVLWSVCNTSTCYPGQGMNAYFPQIVTTDTIKVCYDASITELNTTEVCTRCDSLVFDQNTYTWVLFNMNTVGVNELTLSKINDNKIYDMLGRELTEIPLGKMYIRNQKLYITK